MKCCNRDKQHLAGDDQHLTGDEEEDRGVELEVKALKNLQGLLYHHRKSTGTRDRKARIFKLKKKDSLPEVC